MERSVTRPTLQRKLVPCLLAGLAAMSLPVMAASDHSTGDGSGTDNDRLLPGQYPATPGTVDLTYVEEPHNPFFEIDWSVGLRGGFTHDNEGAHYQSVLAPRIELSHQGRRAAIGLEGTAEIGLPVDGSELTLRGLGVSGTAGYAIDSLTDLVVEGEIGVERPDPFEPGLDPDIAVPGEVASGGFGGELTREFGRFDVTASGNAERRFYGPTTLVDGTNRPNFEQNVWALEGGLRLGYQVTPIIEVFGLGEVGRDIFDNPSTSLGIKGDATDYAFSAGVLGEWNGILAAEVSIGAGMREFDAASIDAINTTLFNASLTFTPDDTWAITADLASLVEPPGIDGAGLARIATEASAELEYTVNSWLRLRANADWYSARFVGSDETETGHGLGLGADYAVNAHTALSADYTFDHVARSAETPEDTHRVMLGITVSR
jgi:hypothetical protein